MTTYPNARRGDIWCVTDDALGGCSESDRTIRGARPVLVISSDGHNFTSPCLTVVPISSGPHRLGGTDSRQVILNPTTAPASRDRAQRWSARSPPSTAITCSALSG